MVLVMPSKSKDKDFVKVTIPLKLNNTILKVQVENNTKWNEACVRAADLINTNSLEFKNSVQREAERLHKRRFLGELNKAKNTIR